jgi:hypothetical protein
MIIVSLSIAAIAAGAWAVFQTSKTKKLENSLLEKSSMIHALQVHSETVEFDLLKAKLEISTLKSNVQSLNDKAKAASKMKAEKVSVKAVKPTEAATVSNKPKKVYKKKSKVTA